MSALKFENLLEIIVRSLNYMDRRLTGHGERVAYQLMELLKEDRRFRTEDICRLIWITLMHDVGNFQNTEIKDLLQQENDVSFSHARYGYLFLKYAIPFSRYNKVVLYHHSGRREIERSDMTPELKWAAKCLMVADAADLYRISNPGADAKALLEFIEKLSRERYDEEALAAVAGLFKKQCALPSQERMHKELLCQLKEMEIGAREEQALLQVLINSIDFRSRYTALHCAIMVEVSDFLAELCGLSEEECYQVHIGATLHDLGKIAIPLSILESSGKLQGEDWEIMKSHVELTEKIIKGLVSEEALRIAVRHHETLDGRGYPRGLTERELTLSERIVAVGDVVSALSEERSYKSAFSLSEILSILDEMCAGKKLCPYVVGILKENKEAIYEKALNTGRQVRFLYNRIQEEYEGGREHTEYAE